MAECVVTGSKFFTHNSSVVNRLREKLLFKPELGTGRAFSGNEREKITGNGKL